MPSPYEREITQKTTWSFGNVSHVDLHAVILETIFKYSFFQREYEILISDYNRAKALFQNTEVTSFKKGK